MITAADRDKSSNDSKLPATAKLAMLDEVMGVLRKSVLLGASSPATTQHGSRGNS